MKNLQNFHVIVMKVVPMTNNNPVRVKLISARFKQTIIIPMANEPGSAAPALETAQNWLESKGFDLIGKAEGPDSYYIITDTFEPLKPKKS